MPASGLVTRRSWITSPPPTLAPIVSTANCSTSRPSPNQCSASISASRSLAIAAGQPSRACSMAPRSTSRQPRNGARPTCEKSLTTPPRPDTDGGRPAGRTARQPLDQSGQHVDDALAASVVRAASDSAATIPARRSVSTPWAVSPVSLIPTKCCSRGIDVERLRRPSAGAGRHVGQLVEHATLDERLGDPGEAGGRQVEAGRPARCGRAVRGAAPRGRRAASTAPSRPHGDPLTIERDITAIATFDSSVRRT